jgi:hypothetical protein
MRRGVARVTQVLALALLAGAGRAQAQAIITIDDVQIRELSSGSFVLRPITVRTSPAPPPSDVTVDWVLVAGSAKDLAGPPDNDFIMANGTLTFSQFGDGTEDIPVQINADTVNEWTLPLTYHQDEVFFIQLSNPTNATIQKGRATVTLLDDDRPMPGLQFLAAVSGGTGAAGQNKLLWRVPAAPIQPNDILIRWNSDAGCAPPATATEPLSGADAGQGYFVATFLNVMGGAGALQSWVHGGRQLNRRYCYSLFTYYGGSPTGEPMSVAATPFDAATGPVAWRYSPGCYPPCGAAALAPPTVGLDAIYTVDNYGVVHAMARGASGGSWPTTPFPWNPVSVGKPTQNRSPVVPLNGVSRLFLGTDGGGVHAVDARFGNVVWSRSVAFGSALPSLTTGTTQAQPAGLFKPWGGNNDMLLVGTNNALGNNAFFALQPATGADIASYPDPAMGNVTGMAVVDYAANRVYFGTSEPSATLFALDLGPTDSPGLTLSPLAWNPKPMGTGTYGAPVLRGGTVYLGDSTGEVHTLHLSDSTSYACPTGDGPVKGFVWPDRRDDRLYFATNGKVHGFRDPVTASPFSIWSTNVTSPSMVLQKPGSDFLYVGDGNGNLVQIDVSNPSPPTLLPLEGPGVQIGAPSLDGGFGLVLVGSSTGTIHAVRVPF